MATFIEYSAQPSMRIWAADLTPVGYVAADPEQVFRSLLPNYHVVDYLGVSIPSRSKHENHNRGLVISPVADGIGLDGTIEMLQQSDLFQDCRHDTFSDVQKRNIVGIMKSKIAPWQEHQGPLPLSEIEKYVTIFDALGHPMSADELEAFTTHETYGNPVPNGVNF